jgi:hypothetical protein
VFHGGQLVIVYSRLLLDLGARCVVWQKLDKYYNLTDRSPSTYAAAILFNSTRRKAYFDDQWISKTIDKWKETVLARVRTTWEEEYKNTPLQDEEVTQQRKKPDLLDKYLRRPQLEAIEGLGCL